MNTELEEKVTSSLVDGRLRCPVAFKIGKEWKVLGLEERFLNLSKLTWRH
jgi:hypothetical protein